MAVSLVKLFNQYVSYNYSNMSELTSNRHVDELTHHPLLNVDDMKDVKYIHEFDRYVSLPGHDITVY